MIIFKYFPHYSSGDGCGTAEFSTNVRVTAYLDWILSKTMSTVYCVK